MQSPAEALVNYLRIGELSFSALSRDNDARS